MIGRQIFALNRSDLRKSLADFGFPSDKETVDSIFCDNNGYAEMFLRYLGANQVHSFDYSDYEGATHIQDMNQPIPDEFKERYSVVLDGGSLEHVFNFPVAIKNCMEMVQVGGHYIGMTPANNFMGHGFYQLSPELYFSVFTEEYGYELVDLIAYENWHEPKWFSVKNPKAINQRVTLINNRPVVLLILAKRINRRTIFKNMPQQSDYISTWTQSQTRFTLERGSLLTYIKLRLPTSLKQIIWQLLWPFKDTFDRRFFEPFESPNNKQSLNKALQRYSNVRR